jgi:predicted 2-oxoglutarate/Fe(II)-dependent dioxygenase YbiX
MKQDLLSYVKHYKSFLNQSLCDTTVSELDLLDKSLWNGHEFYNPINNKFTKESGNQELSTLYSKNISTKEIIMKELWNGIYDYIMGLNFSWYNGWTAYSEIRFNKYAQNTKMAEHCDHIHSLFDGTIKGVPILSVLGVLNDNYKGGEFIMFQKQKITLKQGELLIFPSNFLYPHRVEPVNKGVRYSYISWVY